VSSWRGARGAMELARGLERSIHSLLKAIVWEMRRSRRLIVPPESRVKCESPIFVVGVHRSGTTLLRLILDSHPSIACPPESFFIGPLQELMHDAKAVEGLLAMGFDRDHVLARIRELVSYFFETYAASKGKERWADKTPSYIDYLDFIETLYGPRCRYVLLYRHGLDVACSAADMRIREMEPYVAECGGDRLAGAASYWSAQCAKQLAFQERHPERCLEVRYEELTRDPEPHLRALFDFLEEPWAPAILRFYEQDHDHWFGLQDGKAGDSTSIEPRSGAWRQRAPAEVAVMRAHAELMLRRLGYDVP
jgi:protein-tyrosine sulfotransferase